MSDIVSTNIEGWGSLGDLRAEFGDRAWQASRFLMAYARTGVMEGSCSAAGIEISTGKYWISKPSAVRAVHSCREWLFRTEGASTGYRVLMELAQDAATPANVRAQSAKTLLALGGHSEALAAQATQAGQATKPLHDMTPDELERLISGASATLSSLRRPVIEADPPVVTPDSADPASLF